MFSLLTWLEREGVEVVEAGPNVARGHKNIQCPFCGPLDKSHHMGVRISDGAWACWRDKRHRGRSPVKIVMAIRRCSFESACEVVGQSAVVTPESLPGLRKRLAGLADEAKPAKATKIEMEPGFKQPSFENLRYKYAAFLRRYNLTDAQIPLFIGCYDIRSAIAGDWAGRVIVPVYHPLTTELAGWTARHIKPRGDTPRYKAFPPGDELKKVLYCPRMPEEYNQVIVVEGPFDAMKLDFFGDEDTLVLASMGTSMTQEQVAMTGRLTKDRPLAISFDPGATAQAMVLRDSLSFIRNVKVKFVPPGVEDWGAASPQEIHDWLDEHF